MTKFIFVLIFFTALGSALAEDKNHFFSNLEKKTEKQQIDILKTRIQFMGRTGMNLQASRTSALYFKLTTAQNDRLDVFLEVATEPRKTDNFGEIYKLMLQECPVRECFGFLLQNQKVFKNGLKTVVNNYLLENIKYETIDIVLENRDLIKTMWTNFLATKNAKVQGVFKKAVFFGFDEISQDLIDKHNKTLTADKWALINKCRFLYQKDKLAEAQACYDQYPEDPWFGIGKLYIKSVQRQPISKEGDTVISSLLEGTKDSPFLPDALFYKTFLEKKISAKDVDQFRTSGGFTKPSGGFLFLCLAKALGETTQALVEKDLKDYTRVNTEHAFVDVLRGKKEASFVCDKLGTRSIYCEACSGTKSK